MLLYFPFESADHRPQMGLKPLDLSHWIEVDENFSGYIDRKHQLLQKEKATVFQYTHAADEIALELREVLAQHLATKFPDRFSFSNGTLTTGKANFARPTDGESAFFQIGHWTQEDWAILPAKPPVNLIAGSVCFPSRWSLKEKMGGDSHLIHAPVPGFSSIAKPAQAFLERITIEKPVWRLNWTIHDTDELFTPTPHPPRTDLTTQNVLDKTYLRVERQTLRRLPKTGGVIFSIRTYVHSMRQVVVTDEKRAQVLAALEALPHETAAYRGMRLFHTILLQALKS